MHFPPPGLSPPPPLSSASIKHQGTAQAGSTDNQAAALHLWPPTSNPSRVLINPFPLATPQE